MSGLEVPTILALVGTAASVYSRVQQGQAQSRESKRQEKAAEIDSMSREIQRTKRLNAYMATQNATAGAGGVAVSGSLANAQNVAVRENRLGLATDRAATDLRVQGYRDRAKYAKRASLVGAAGAAASGLSNAYQIEHE